jgi:hypothetical protein
MANLNRFTGALWDLDTFYIFDDFWMDQTDLTAVDTITDTGTALVGDETRGIMTLTPSDGTVADNDEVYIATPNECFLFAAGRPIYGECRLLFAETTATVYNVAFGFMNAVGANTIVDTTGLPKTSGSTLCIYKTTTTAVWKVASAVNGVATHTTSTAGAVAATWYVLKIICDDAGDGVNMRCTFRVNDAPLRDSNNLPIVHTIPIASATEMQMFAGAKLGAATNNDTTKVDYWYGAQKR